MKFKLIALLFVFLFNVILITSLYLDSIGYNLKKKNGFSRTFTVNVDVIFRRSLPFNSYYLAGLTDSRVFLANIVNASELLITDNDLNHFETKEIYFDTKEAIAWGALEVVVDSPNIYLHEFVKPTFFSGSLKKTKVIPVATAIKSADAAIPISPNKYVVKMLDTLHAQRDLFLLNYGEVMKKHRSPFLKRQGDGTFSTDGMLLFDRITYKIIYVYYYRNHVQVFDSSLNKVTLLRTIDTVQYAEVMATTIKSSGNRTLIKLSEIINNKATVYDNHLYIHSTREADNQSQSHQTVIDYYDLHRGVYVYSFYIPVNPKSVTSLMVNKNRMYVVADKELLILRLLD